MRIAQSLYRDVIAVLIAAAILAVVILGLAALVISETGNRITWWGPAPVLERYKRIQAYGYAVVPLTMNPVAEGAGLTIMKGGSENPSAQPQILNLSTEDVRSYFQRWIDFSGNNHIKVGEVAERDGDSVLVDIVTIDKSGLAERFLVDRHTGLFRPEN